MRASKILDSEKLGEICGSIAVALRQHHPDVPLEHILADWTEIGNTLPLASAICGSIDTAFEKFAADYRAKLGI